MMQNIPAVSVDSSAMGAFFHAVVAALEFRLIVELAETPFAGFVLVKAGNARAVILGTLVGQGEMHGGMLAIGSSLSQVGAVAGDFELEFICAVLAGALRWHKFHGDSAAVFSFVAVIACAVVDAAEILSGEWRFG